MKYVDKFLKKLNVNRNTFATFILTLITIYIGVDRIVEMIFMALTGVPNSYWGPIAYTFAIACPVFAYAFAGSSSFADTRPSKVTLFYTFMIGFYVIVISMFTQFLNMGVWLIFMSSPNYITIVTNYSELIRPAFCALSLYLPLTTFYPFLKFVIFKIDDNQTAYKSLWDFKGISLSNPKAKHGPYMCDVTLFKDFDNNKMISMPEERRFQSLLVCGSSGTGKTSEIFEPMIGQDIEKKYFFKESSKELGFTALKTGIANLQAPYSNDYLNKNFTLDMLIPAFGKETLFNTFVQKMVLSGNVYKNMGLTYMSPDYETLSTMMKVCDNYDIEYELVDPSQAGKSIGLNPFTYDDPIQIAVIISSTLQGIASSEQNEIRDTYKEEAFLQILENLTILLKVIYPKMHEGALPNMADLLTLLSNFALVEKMCKVLKKDEELAEKYQMEISYFERTFFENAKGRAETESNAYFIASRLENLLRAPSIRTILCNRYNNINFDDVLKNGKITFVCTRRGESGKVAHKAFGLFFLLSLQHAILKRPGNEKTRIPHFLYIDEFPDFLSKDTEAMFTLYRKYRVATTISAQSISQFDPNADKDNFNSVVLGNCQNKIYTGGSSPINELKWWSDEIGNWKQWQFTQSYDGAKDKMGSTLSGVKYDYKTKLPAGRLQTLGTNHCAYKILNDGGKPVIGEGVCSRLASKHKEKHQSKKYNFAKYSTGTGDFDDTENSNISTKFNPKKLNFKDSDDEYNPVQNASTKYSFDEEGAIVINLKNNE